MTNDLGLFNTNLLKLLIHKMSYLQASALQSSQNVAKADIPEARKKELKPFEKVVKKTAHGLEMNLNEEHVINTGEQINREAEVLNLQTLAMDYQSLIHIYKRYHEMIRVAIGRS